MENKFNILVCDDDKSIVDAIEIYLKQEMLWQESIPS